MKGIITILAILFMALNVTAQAAQTPSKMGAAVYIISPSHGELVSSPVKIRFGLVGMGIAPAGVDVAGTGHHHLLVDLEGEARLNDRVPSDAKHLHFGKGQTETTLELSAGKHTLQLLLADRNHVPHHPAIVSRKIIIYVK